MPWLSPSYFVFRVLRVKIKRQVTILAWIIRANNQELIIFLGAPRLNYNVKGTNIEPMIKKIMVNKSSEGS